MMIPPRSFIGPSHEAMRGPFATGAFLVFDKHTAIETPVQKKTKLLKKQGVPAERGTLGPICMSFMSYIETVDSIQSEFQRGMP
jgi:hypothetical protein